MLLTFDLEPEWVTLPVKHDRAAWDYFPDSTERSFHKFLDICESTGSKCTIFVVGQYAKRFPERVSLAYNLGHHIGTHSLWHEDMSEKADEDFIEDVRQSKEILEEITGAEINAFRAPSFRIKPSQIKLLSQVGIKYDSSVCLSLRLNSVRGQVSVSHRCRTYYRFGEVVEIPFIGQRILNRNLPILGGGYLRLTPMVLFKLLPKNLHNEMIYLHPHDLHDYIRRYRHMSYAQYLMRNLKFGITERKLRFLLNKSPGISIDDYIHLQSLQ